MNTFKAIGFAAVVLVIALVGVSSVWAGPPKGTVEPPPIHKGQPACASVGEYIDEVDLPEGMLVGKSVTLEDFEGRDEVRICIAVPNDHGNAIGHFKDLNVLTKASNGEWVSLPTVGFNYRGTYYRVATISLPGNYYLPDPDEKPGCAKVGSSIDGIPNRMLAGRKIVWGDIPEDSVEICFSVPPFAAGQAADLEIKRRRGVLPFVPLFSSISTDGFTYLGTHYRIATVSRPGSYYLSMP
jgi:hypothetical protein